MGVVVQVEERKEWCGWRHGEGEKVVMVEERVRVK